MGKANQETICYCMLIRQDINPYCSKTMKECERCGWNPAVHAEREKHLKAKGLTLCSDGLKRLIMPKKKGGHNEAI